MISSATAQSYCPATFSITSQGTITRTHTGDRPGAGGSGEGRGCGDGRAARSRSNPTALDGSGETDAVSATITHVQATRESSAASVLRAMRACGTGGNDTRPNIIDAPGACPVDSVGEAGPSFRAARAQAWRRFQS